MECRTTEAACVRILTKPELCDFFVDLWGNFTLEFSLLSNETSRRFLPLLFFCRKVFSCVSVASHVARRCQTFGTERLEII